MSELWEGLTLLCPCHSSVVCTFCGLDEEKQFFKVKSVFKVPEEPKKVAPEERFPKLKPRREEEPPAKGIMAL